jgi:hypothetical protein
MDRLSRYRSLLKQFLQERADLMKSHPIAGLETFCLFDEARDQYLIYNVGWPGGKRARYVTLFARLHNGKIWIEEDNTEEGLATLLVEAGVPKADIVLAFLPPELRDLTE